MTKRGTKSTPSFIKLSFSDFLSAYSSGKFFCIMLFRVTLEKEKHQTISKNKLAYEVKYQKSIIIWRHQAECIYYPIHPDGILSIHLSGIPKLIAKKYINFINHSECLSSNIILLRSKDLSEKISI